MITFKPITIEDKAEIESFTLPYAPANCDLAFANMFCWQFQFKTAWSVVDGFLVIRFQIGGSDRIGYMQPVGAGDFTPVLRHLEEDILAAGQRLRIIDMTPEGLEKLRSVGHCQFAFASDRNLEDYVYNASDLRDLPGRKYQSKRNHINRFEAEYEYRYEPMTRDHAAECMRLEAEWRKTRSGHTGELSAEQRAMQRAFAHFDRLGLIGGCIYVGDRLAAFTYGSAVNDHTFDTHVEKADTEFDGAFTVINKLFAQHLPERFTLINREEDLGLDGLRQAKLSYHPAFLQHKFTAICMHPDELACKELWMKAFGDDEQFADSFIMRYYSRRRMLTAEAEGRTAAMLHLLPFRTELGRTTYIYGVATDPAFRGRGLASQLMREAMRLIADRGDDAAFLIPTPGKEWLREFYGRFGFAGDVPTEFVSADRFDFGTGDAAADRAMVWRRTPEGPLPEQLTASWHS
ncbi:MAG: GNAT family N-acetyltransferase [Alistipes sp.]|nr:GNAT family N-acetyltransferase [Alistipes sp.]MBE5686480.1 GNAT family N-acetyltransferase [Alistipes sp.]